MTKLNFQIICVDTDKKIKVHDSKNLLYLLLSNSELWTKSELRGQTIYEKDKSISCTVNKISSDEDDTNTQTSFDVSVSGTYKKLEPFRLKILEFLSHQNFKHLYVVQDNISKDIACHLYPLINMLENNLRAYLMKFFITKLGVGWWESTADNDMKNKANLRKNNEKEFSKFIDNKVYLIDFGELGRMVYSLSTGFISKNDILNKFQEIETIEEMNIFKDELQSNYNKFFKESFRDKSFQKKWESVEKVRNKVAHNNLFTDNDLINAEKDCKELLKIIEDANKALNTFNFTEKEKETIVVNSFSSNNMFGYFIKNWNIFINKLDLASSKYGFKTRSRHILSPKSMFLYLHNERLIDDILYRKIKYLIAFRNELVHNPNNELIENEIEEKIKDLDYVISKLEILIQEGKIDIENK